MSLRISQRKLGKNPSVFTTAELQKTKENKRKQQETDINTIYTKLTEINTLFDLTPTNCIIISQKF